MPTLEVVIGNPKSHSRTRTIAELIAERVARITGAVAQEPIELIDTADELFTWPSERLDALGARVAAADYVVFATPTYKASYTGLLKSFLDRYPSGGLDGVTAVPVFTIASPAHRLAVEFTLRPLLVELGASVPTQGVSFETPNFDRREELIDEWAASQGKYLVGGERAGAGA